MAQRLPPELENKLARYQVIQSQLNRVVQERVSVEAEIAEINRILSVLEEQSGDVKVYRAIGNVLVRVEREKLVNELKDRKEILELRLQKLKKQEEQLRKQLDEVANEIKKLQTRLQAPPTGAGAGAG